VAGLAGDIHREAADEDSCFFVFVGVDDFALVFVRLVWLEQADGPVDVAGRQRAGGRVVQIHPDADSVEFHMNVVRERAERAYAETLDATTSIQVYGTPSDTVLEMLKAQAGSEVSLSVRRHHLGGFTRTQTS
jgi:hypothetical protein